MRPARGPDGTLPDRLRRPPEAADALCPGIVHVTVSDMEACRQAVREVLAWFRSRFILRAAAQDAVERGLRPRTLAIGFPDLASAKSFCASPEYQAMTQLHEAASASDLSLTEGCEAA